MSLFDQSPEALALQPLAERMRPKNLDEFIGQEKAIGPASVLGRALRAGRLMNLILWGPPGVGKTSFARLLAQNSQAHFVALNAVSASVKEIREYGEQGRRSRIEESRQTLLFMDEIHRLNKSQQEVLLPFMETGDLVLVGATTENPSYELNRAILSRARLVVFEALTPDDLKKCLNQSLAKLSLSPDQILTPEAQSALAHHGLGDARRLLTVLELVLLDRPHLANQGKLPLTGTDLAPYFDSQRVFNDKSGESHYDVVSAFIKSIRGSDADAGLYYLARMIKSGEDPVFIARRLVILASEDVGNADPRGLSVAVAGLQAVELVGMPEAGICLAQVVTYLASAPKSNASYEAYHLALDLVDRTGPVPVPLHLRSSKTSLSKAQGYGKGYLYPHSFPHSWVKQDYLPAEVVAEAKKVFDQESKQINESNKDGPSPRSRSSLSGGDSVGSMGLYSPKNIGFEKNIIDYQKWLRNK